MTESTSIQKWSGFDDEAEQEMRRATDRKGKFLKLKAGRNQLRFLPAPLGRKPLIATYNHFVELVPGDDQTKVNFNCPKRMAKRPCPLCAKAEELVNGSKRDKDRAFSLFPSLRVYAAVVDRADEDAGVQILAFGKSISEGLMEVKATAGDFTNPTDKGFDVIVSKKGSGKTGTKYSVSAVRGSEPLFDDVVAVNEILDQLPDLVQYAIVPSDEEIRDMIADAKEGKGVGSEAAKDARDEDDGGRSTRRGTAGSRGTRRRDDDVIDTDGETVEDNGSTDWD